MRAAFRKAIAHELGLQSTELPAEVAATRPGRTALLVTQDKTALLWAPRSLQHSGLDVKIAKSATEAMEIMAATRPGLVLADAAIDTGDDTALLRALCETCAETTAILALCNNDVDVGLANDCGVTDIMRRPFDWDLISRRAARALEAREIRSSTLPTRWPDAAIRYG